MASFVVLNVAETAESYGALYARNQLNSQPMTLAGFSSSLHFGIRIRFSPIIPRSFIMGQCDLIDELVI